MIFYTALIAATRIPAIYGARFVNLFSCLLNVCVDFYNPLYLTAKS